jgi:hypothetical protein
MQIHALTDVHMAFTHLLSHLAFERTRSLVMTCFQVENAVHCSRQLCAGYDAGRIFQSNSRHTRCSVAWQGNQAPMQPPDIPKIGVVM